MKASLPLFYLLIFTSLPLFAQGQNRLETTGRDSSTSSQITVSDYCLFLNAAALSDPLGLYDEKMENQATDYRLQATGSETTACCLITRSGKPGHYSYAAAEEKANAPINYLNWQNTAYYYDWLENVASIFNFDGSEVTDRYFTAHDSDFYLLSSVFNASRSETPAVTSSQSKPNGTFNLEESVIAAMEIAAFALALSDEGDIAPTENTARHVESPRLKQYASSHSDLSLPSFSTTMMRARSERRDHSYKRIDLIVSERRLRTILDSLEQNKRQIHSFSTRIMTDPTRSEQHRAKVRELQEQKERLWLRFLEMEQEHLQLQQTSTTSSSTHK